MMRLNEIEEKLKSRLDFHAMKELASGISTKEVKCQDLIALCAHHGPQLAFRASWVLAFVAHTNPVSFLPHLTEFLILYPKATNQSVQRNFTKILMLLTSRKFMLANRLNAAIFDDCLTASFDWLLHPTTDVAVQANALEAIFQLTPFHDWILDELKVILQQKLVSGSPALVSRAKRILKNIN